MTSVCILNVNPNQVSDLFSDSMVALAVEDAAGPKLLGGKITEHTTVNINHARNKTVKRFLETDHTHALFLDSDIVFPHDLIQRLSREMFLRQADILHVPYVQPNRKQLVHGLGCVMATRDALQKIKNHTGLSMGWFREDYIDGQWISEDTWFFMQAREAGLSVLSSNETEVGHDKYRRVWWPHDLLTESI